MDETLPQKNSANQMLMQHHGSVECSWIYTNQSEITHVPIQLFRKVDEPFFECLDWLIAAWDILYAVPQLGEFVKKNGKLRGNLQNSIGLLYFIIDTGSQTSNNDQKIAFTVCVHVRLQNLSYIYWIGLVDVWLIVGQSLPPRMHLFLNFVSKSQIFNIHTKR